MQRLRMTSDAAARGVSSLYGQGPGGVQAPSGLVSFSGRSFALHTCLLKLYLERCPKFVRSVRPTRLRSASEKFRGRAQIGPAFAPGAAV